MSRNGALGAVPMSRAKLRLHPDEVENQDQDTQNVRVISTILDPSGSKAGTVVSESFSVPLAGEAECDQSITVTKRPCGLSISAISTVW